MYRFILCCAFTALLSSCINDSNAERHHEVAFDLVSTGTQSGIHNQQLRVIRSAEQLSALLSEATFTGQIPNPDFTTSTVIAIMTGTNSGCGNALTVTRVEDNSQTQIVHATLSVPGPNTVCPTVVTNDGPYVMIEVAASSKPISLLFAVNSY